MTDEERIIAIYYDKKYRLPIADLLPHDPPMVLLDQIEAYQDDFIHTSLTIHENTIFLEAESVPAYVALEYMAQTVGVWNGLRARQQGEQPKIGFLLGARRLTLEVTTFKLNQKLDVYGKINYIDNEMGAFDCWIEIDGVCVARAGLNVFSTSGEFNMTTEKKIIQENRGPDNDMKDAVKLDYEVGVLLSAGKFNPGTNIQSLHQLALKLDHPCATLIKKGEIPIDEERAIKYLKKAADNKHPSAMLQLGILFRDSLGKNQNDKMAEEWLSKALKENHPDAYYHLGLLFEFCYPELETGDEKAKSLYKLSFQKGNDTSAEAAYRLARLCYQDKKFDEAAQWFRKAAEKGHVGAACSLANMLRQGKEIGQDLQEAERFYRKAIEGGNSNAAYNLAMLLLSNKNNPENEKEGIKFLKQAASAGHAHALVQLGIKYYSGKGVPKNKHNALAYLKQAYTLPDKQQSAYAAYILGDLHWEGIPDVLKKDQAAAFSYYEQAHLAGRAEGTCGLARCYAAGAGVTQNDKKALKFYKEAFEKGSVQAAQELGSIHKNGKGVKKDFSKAIYYYTAAANKGNPYAAIALAMFHELGIGTAKNEIQAIHWYQMAAGFENPHYSATAACLIGNKYLNGAEGLPKDEKLGLKWILKAAEQNDPSAAYVLASAYCTGDYGITPDFQAAIPWFKKAANEGHPGASLIVGKFNLTNCDDLGLKRDEKSAERYLRAAAVWGASDSLFDLANVIRNRNEALADYLVMGDTLSNKEEQRESKKEGALKYEWKLYELFKRLADIHECHKEYPAEFYGSNSANIYSALERAFDLLPRGNGAIADDLVLKLQTAIEMIEQDLASLELIKARLQRSKAAAQPFGAASIEMKNDSASIESEEDYEIDIKFDLNLISFPAQAKTETKTEAKENLPPMVVALHGELLRLEDALKESRDLMKEHTIDTLTNRREGLLALMGRICRYIAEMGNVENKKALGIYSSLYDSSAQHISNYIWHHGGLSPDIKEPISAECISQVAAIHRAAEDMQAHFSQKIQAIQKTQAVKDVSLKNLARSSIFLREILASRCEEFNPGDQIRQYATLTAKASFRKRGNQVLANEKWLRLIAMTESAYAQIRDTNPKQYREEKLAKAHKTVQEIGKWIRHPCKEITPEDLVKIVRKKQKQYKHADWLVPVSWDVSESRENPADPIDTKQKTKGDAKRGPITGNKLALKNSPIHSAETKKTTTHSATAASSAGSAAPSSVPAGLV